MKRKIEWNRFRLLALATTLLFVSATYFPLTLQNSGALTNLPISRSCFPPVPPAFCVPTLPPVPLSWCAFDGSPAASPHGNRLGGSLVAYTIPHPFPDGPVAATTDMILRDRHARAGFFIFLPQAGIFFQNAIPIARDTTSASAPIIPIISGGAGHGDVIGVLNPQLSLLSAWEDQFFELIRQCRNQWQSQHHFNLGLTVVNVRNFLTRDRSGHYSQSPVLGMAGCRNAEGATIGNVPVYCADGIAVVSDNVFTFPVQPYLAQSCRDPHDIVLATLLAGALGWHLQVVGATFNPGDLIQSMDGIPVLHCTNGIADNEYLNYPQIQVLRANANSVPRMNVDPPGKLLKTDLIQTYEMAKRNENITIPKAVDLSAIYVVLNRTANRISIGQELFGLIPNKTENNLPLQYWTFVDTDNNKNTGADHKLLQEIRAPPTFFHGADLATKAMAYGSTNVTSWAWQFRDGKLIKITNDGIQSNNGRLVVYPLYSNGTSAENAKKEDPSAGTGVALNDKISVTIDNKLANISLNRPFNLQAIIANTSKNQDDLPIVMDKLDYSGNEQGAKLALLEPKVVDAESELSNLAMNETKK